MARKLLLAVERLRELLDYDPLTGELRWRITRGNARAGRVAGWIEKRTGYRHVEVNGGRYRASHLVWLYVHGEWPALDLDHRNHVRSDNRIENLREATKVQNLQNRRGPQRNNTSGYLGVHPTKHGRWGASIQVDGKQRWLGSFATPEEAAAAYTTAKRACHPFWAE